MTIAFTPPTITPPDKPLGVFQSLRAMRQNVLGILPAISYSQPIVSGNSGTVHWHMVQGPEGLRRIFLDNVDNYPKSEVMIRMLRSAVGESLFTSEGAQWRWQRRAIAPVFASRNVNSLAPIMSETADRTSARLATKGGQVEMVKELLSATFEVICDVASSGRDHMDADVYGAAITRCFLTVGRASLLDFLEFPPWFPRPGQIFGAGAVRTANDMVSHAIQARRSAGPGPREDLFDFMARAKDPKTGRSMNDRDLLHNMQFFIIAGHETTALAVAWALYMLANDQEAQDRAREEARRVLDGEPAGADDLTKLPYSEQILEETMRLYPPVGLLARNVLEPDVIYERNIRPRETVFLNIYALHRHHLYWERPETFDPERFSPENRAARDRYTHVPFGAGPRICVGANFAMMQAQIILTTLLSRFRFRPSGPTPEPVMHMTIRPDPGVTLSLEPI